jgi:hypothetical protein
MKIAKPILLVSTPIGVVGGLNEAYHLAGGLVVIMAAMVALIAVAATGLVLTVRREQRAIQAGNSGATAREMR